MRVKMVEQGHAGFVLGFIYDCFPPVLSSCHLVSRSPSCPACPPRGLPRFPEVSSQDKGHSPLVRRPRITNHSTLISWHRQRAPPPLPHPHTSRLHRRLPLLCHLFRTYSGPDIPRPRRRISPAAGEECRPGQDEHQRRASTGYPVSLSFVYPLGLSLCQRFVRCAIFMPSASSFGHRMVLNIVSRDTMI